MGRKLKITLVDFDDMVYVMYANGKAEANKCIENLGNTEWKIISIKPVK